MSGSSRFFTGVSLFLSSVAGCCAGAEEGNQNWGFPSRPMNGERWQTDLEEFSSALTSSEVPFSPLRQQATTICSFAGQGITQSALMFSCSPAHTRQSWARRRSRAPETCSSDQLMIAWAQCASRPLVGFDLCTVGIGRRKAWWIARPKRLPVVGRLTARRQLESGSRRTMKGCCSPSSIAATFESSLIYGTGWSPTEATSWSRKNWTSSTLLPPHCA